MPFIEVSAKSGVNISKVFDIIGRDIKEKILDVEEKLESLTA